MVKIELFPDKFLKISKGSYLLILFLIGLFVIVPSFLILGAGGRLAGEIGFCIGLFFVIEDIVIWGSD